MYYICDVCDAPIHFDKDKVFGTCSNCQSEYTYRVGWSDNPRDDFEYPILGNVRLIRGGRIDKPSSSELEDSRFES
jgi:hypothetical protein